MNRSNKGANTNIGQMLVDIFFLILAYVFSYYAIEPLPRDYRFYFAAVITSFIVLYIYACKESRLYNVTFFFYLDRFAKIVTKSWLVAALPSALIVISAKMPEAVLIHFEIYLVTSYVMVIFDMLISRYIQRWRSNRQAPRVAYVGYYENYQKFNYFLNKTSIKIEQMGYILTDRDVETKHNGMVKVLGRIEDIEQIIRENNLDQIYFIQRRDTKPGEFQIPIETCVEMGVTAKVVIDKYIDRHSDSFVSSVGVYPVMTYHTIYLNQTEKLVKRFFDVIVSAVAIVISSPIMLCAAIAVKLDSPGPVIFKQNRVGQNGRVFKMYKFRSMYRDAEEKKAALMEQNECKDGMMFKMKNDPRITRVGRFLRKTSIDELPQLFNVFFGTMSLVGTRPPTEDEVMKYKRQHWRRISIKPGITGMWQVSGRSKIVDFEKTVELDLQYIDNWSIRLDLWILIKTAFVLFFHKSEAY